MLQDKIWHIFLFLLISIFWNSNGLIIDGISTDLDINLRSCGFKCGNDNEKDTHIKGYYWRDYFGIIPPDAFPLGNGTTNPRTYIGLAFDPSKRGFFPITIFEGKDQVYTVLDGKVAKKSAHIQILCTMEPAQLVWRQVNNDNIDQELENRSLVKASYHITRRLNNHYVTSTSKNGLTYAGTSNSLVGEMEYVLIDGKAEATKNYHFLLYSLRETESQKSKAQLGQCSITCTNQNNLGTEDKRKIQMSKNAMKYYWKPLKLADEREKFKAGISLYKSTLYVGRVFSKFNRLDVGAVQDSSVKIYNPLEYKVETIDIHIFSTQKPEDFEFVYVSTTNFSSLDTSRLIPGGEMNNGTQILIGRKNFHQAVDPGSIRVVNSGPVLYYAYGKTLDFHVLMSKNTD